MTHIKAAIEVNTPLEKVWSIVSDLDSEPKFWKGTKEIRNITKQGNIISREITIAFKDSKCLQTVTLYPMEKIHIQFTKGIIEGTKTISLSSHDSKTQLEAVWKSSSQE